MKLNNTIWIIGLLLLVVALTPNVHAATTSQKAYVNFTNIVSSTVVLNVWNQKLNFTESNGPVYSTDFPTFNVSGTGKNASTLLTSASSQDFRAIGLFDPDAAANGMSFGGWFNVTSNTTTQQLFAFTSTGASGGTWIGINANKYIARIGNSAGTMDTTSASGPIPQNKWIHVFLVFNSTGRVYLFVNGKSIWNISAVTPSNNGADFYIGQRGDTVNFVNGKIDEVKVYNRSFKPSEMRSLYNIGNTSNFAQAPLIANFTISIRDKWNTSLFVKNVNASIIQPGVANDFNYTTSNGTIVTGIRVNSTKLVNITFVSNYSGGYFNHSRKSINVSTTLQVRMFQAEARFTVWQKISNNTITTGQLFNRLGNTSTSGRLFYLRAGIFNITFVQNNVHYNMSKLFTFSARTNTSGNIISGVYNQKLNVTGRVGGSSTLVNNFVINISLLTSSLTTNSYRQVINTTSSSGILNLINGSYSILALKPNVYANFNKNITMSQRLKYLNATFFQWNTFNITILDEENLTLIKNSSFTAYGLTTSYSNFTQTQRGKANLTLLVPDIYNFVYKDKFGQYHERFRYIGLQNGTFNNVQLYLLTAGRGIDFTVTLVDQFSNPLPGYIIPASKLIPASNSFITVQSERTNVDGLAKFFLRPENSQYIFRALGGTLSTIQTQYATTNLTKLFGSTLTMKATLTGASEVTGPTLSAWRLRTKLYNKSTIIYLNWTTLGTTGGTICLNVTHSNRTSSRVVYGTCSSSPSGSITYNFSSFNNGTINAVAYIHAQSNYFINGLSIVLGKIRYLFQYIGLDALLYYIIFIIIAVAMTITDPRSIPFTLAIVFVLSWVMGLINPTIWTGGAVVVIVATLVILMYKTK